MKTLKDFRSDKALMKAAAKLKVDPIFTTILDVLDTEHIMRKQQNSVGLNADDKTLRLGLIEGYNIALNNLSLIFEPLPEPRKEPQVKFKPV